MAKEWFFADGRERRGPFTYPQLQQMAMTGRITPATMILQQGNQQWQAAVSIPGLLPLFPEKNGVARPARPSRHFVPKLLFPLGCVLLLFAIPFSLWLRAEKERGVPSTVASAGQASTLPAEISREMVATTTPGRASDAVVTAESRPDRSTPAPEPPPPPVASVHEKKESLADKRARESFIGKWTVLTGVYKGSFAEFFSDGSYNFRFQGLGKDGRVYTLTEITGGKWTIENGKLDAGAFAHCKFFVTENAIVLDPQTTDGLDIRFIHDR